MKHPVTPDGRYFLVKDKLWRCTNPNLDEKTRSQLTKKLMEARRAVKKAKQGTDEAAIKAARRKVNKAKVALGERGEVWWTDGAPDFNQKHPGETPYADWYASLDRSES